MRVDFYHLTERPLERVLPAICEKLIEQGQRLLVVGEASLIERLDGELWSYKPASFLPHGRGASERQPILLSTEATAANGARNVALVDGMWREEALAFERAFYFFDADSLDQARTAWRALKGRKEIEPRYWKQSEGGWVEGP